MRLKVQFVLVLSLFLSLVCLSGCGNTNNYSYQKQDVSAELKNADSLYESKQYKEALESYLDAMEKEPKDTDARLGAVKCQINLENYNAAMEGLDILAQIDPYAEEMYELYQTISEKENNYNAIRSGISLAKKYNVESMISKIPSEPKISLPEGSYDSKQTVTLTCEDPDAKIYYDMSMINADGTHTIHAEEVLYDDAITIYSGTTNIYFYSVKDGIPSETASAKYDVDYEGKPVKFKDAVFEKLIRATLDRPTGKITDKELEEVQEIRFYDLTNIEGDNFWNNQSAYQIKTLEDLEFLPNLQTLYMEYQDGIKDYSPLKKCRYLTSLSWEDSKIKNLDFLKYTPKLLYFRTSQVRDLTDISALKKCPDLRTISLYSTKLKNVGIIKDLKNLTDISLADKYIKKEIIGGIDNLRYLGIYGFNFDRDYVSKLTNLTSLDIMRNVSEYYYSTDEGLKNLGFLKKLPYLTSVDLEGVDNIKELDVLKEMKGLTYIYISLRNYDDQQREKLRKDLIKKHPNCTIYVY